MVVVLQEKILIDLVIEMKRRNPSFGYGRISMQIFEAFGVAISRFAVARILRKTDTTLPSGSWRRSVLINVHRPYDGQFMVSRPF